MKVIITDAAKQDMLAIGRYITRDNPVRAMSFIDELEQKCLSIGEMPRGFQLVPRFEDVGVRRRVHGNYLIFYRIKSDYVEVLHVLHGARDLEDLL